MVRFVLFLVCLIAWNGASTAEAQHHHSGHHRGDPMSGNRGSATESTSPIYVSPVTLVGPYPLVAVSGFGAHHHHHHYFHYETRMPFFVGSGPVWFPAAAPLPQPSVVPTVSVFPIVHRTPNDHFDDSTKRPVNPSSPAARLKSLEHQSRGDEKLRKHLWAQAYMNYRSAIDAAGDRGEARLRQGFTYTAMLHYASAVREFKRGLLLDPELPMTGIRLAMLFGPGSEIVRTSILHKVAEWVREDPRDSDRLFLLGLLLHYEDDPRCRDVLKAAQRLADGMDDHIVALLAVWNVKPPVVGGGDGAKPALLFELPALPDGGMLPSAPHLVLPVLKQQPQLVLSPGLPPLSNQPTPPVITPGREPKDR